MVMKTSSAKTIAVGQAKTHLLSLVSEIQEEGTTHILTKRGMPVAKLCPLTAKEKPFRPLRGRGKGMMQITGDIISPACPEEDWAVFAE
jgi:antitoxin (DNA-binding transcriptional repressor) of toxin-antitoxin stability system